MERPIIAIVGIGGEGSVGFELAKSIVSNRNIMQGIGGLYLKVRDNNSEAIKRIDEIVFPTLIRISRECNTDADFGRIQPKRTSWGDIAQKADITYFCYSKYGASTLPVPYWEPANRNKFYKANWRETEGIISDLGNLAGGKDKIKDYFKGQIVFVTNPTHQIAYSFLCETGMDEGQIMAFSPDQERLFTQHVAPISGRYPVGFEGHVMHHKSAQTYYEHWFTDLFVIGEHGNKSALFLPAGFKSDYFNPQAAIDAVVMEGPDTMHAMGSTASGTAPHMTDLIKSCAIKGSVDNPNIFVWGVYYAGMFCSLPFVNVETTDRLGRKVLRAQIVQKYIDDIVNGRGTFVFPSGGQR